MNKLIYTLQAVRQRMRKASPLLILAIATLLCYANQTAANTPSLWAEITVSGKVTDSNGEALIGATIRVRDQVGVGTVTDFDGTYSINVDENAVLIFSFTGYESQEIAVGGRKVIDVMMQESSTLLNQVVVVGYGTLTKKQVTGAIAQVKGDDLKKQPLLTHIQGVQFRRARHAA
jgi:TonB-dependent starch-binding outer membrane protein SusC